MSFIPPVSLITASLRRSSIRTHTNTTHQRRHYNNQEEKNEKAKPTYTIPVKCSNCSYRISSSCSVYKDTIESLNSETIDNCKEMENLNHYLNHYFLMENRIQKQN